MILSLAVKNHLIERLASPVYPLGSFTLTAAMGHVLSLTVEIITTVLAVAGIGYFIAAIVAARLFLSSRDAHHPQFSSGVSILKSLKGTDTGMLDAFRSHCRQVYESEYELLFGVSSFSDPAVPIVQSLRHEFPQHAIHLVECPRQLGANGKVSTLVQLAHKAQYDFLLVNDSDITVSPRYLERVMDQFTTRRLRHQKPPQPVGLVTALYRGKAHGTLPSRLEALGISTDFMSAVLLSRMIEGGLKYGLGSTLAVRRDALEKIGGFEALVDHLADDYELGERIANAGYRVALTSEVVETNVPAYDWRGFADHQLRWLRTVRDARPSGYAGLIFTHGLAWALLNAVASGFSPLSLWLLGMSFFLRLTLAMVVGAEVLSDRQVLPGLWLLPLRDLVAIGLWVAGFAGNTIVWRGEQFEVKGGVLRKIGIDP